MAARPGPAAPDRSGRRPRARRVTAALALAALLGAGCGGGDDEITLPGPESPTAVLTKTELTTRANEICRATTRAVAERNDELAPTNLGGDADAGEARREIEKLARTAITRLRNLTPAPEDAEVATRAWDTMEDAVDAASRDATLPVDPVGLVQPELFSYGFSGCFTTR